MQLKRCAFTAAVILVAEVAATGRVSDPFLVVYAAALSLLGNLAIGPKPRELGRMWGTIDQRIAFEAERETMVLTDLRRGRCPSLSLPTGRLAQLSRIARSELRRARLLALGELALATLFSLSFLVHVASPNGEVIRLVALVVFIPTLTWLGCRGLTMTRDRLRALDGDKGAVPR